MPSSHSPVSVASLVSVSSLISVIISMVNSMIQLHGLNSDIAEVQDTGFGLWAGSQLRIEGLYVHLSFNVTSFHMYIYSH